MDKLQCPYFAVGGGEVGGDVGPAEVDDVGAENGGGGSGGGGGGGDIGGASPDASGLISVLVANEDEDAVAAAAAAAATAAATLHSSNRLTCKVTRGHQWTLLEARGMTQKQLR